MSIGSHRIAHCRNEGIGISTNDRVRRQAIPVIDGQDGRSSCQHFASNLLVRVIGFPLLGLTSVFDWSVKMKNSPAFDVADIVILPLKIYMHGDMSTSAYILSRFEGYCDLEPLPVPDDAFPSLSCGRELSGVNMMRQWG